MADWLATANPHARSKSRIRTKQERGPQGPRSCLGGIVVDRLGTLRLCSGQAIEVAPFQSGEKQPQVLRLATLAQDDKREWGTQVLRLGEYAAG